jgi:AAA15 family ATPase/GTPase
MIHKVRIQNFKSLRDVNIELERFTVFVGANGSGKTSVLEAIHNAVCLHQSISKRHALTLPDCIFARPSRTTAPLQSYE